MSAIKFTRAGLKKHIEEYFDDGESIKSLPGLAVALGIDVRTLTTMQVETEKGKNELLTLACVRIEKDIVENGLKGKYNATMSSFLLKTCFGYSDKGEQSPTGDIYIEVADELKKFAV